MAPNWGASPHPFLMWLHMAINLPCYQRILIKTKMIEPQPMAFHRNRENEGGKKSNRENILTWTTWGVGSQCTGCREIGLRHVGEEEKRGGEERMTCHAKGTAVRTVFDISNESCISNSIHTLQQGLANKQKNNFKCLGCIIKSQPVFCTKAMLIKINSLIISNIFWQSHETEDMLNLCFHMILQSLKCNSTC